ncbi:MAG: hypothetical protein LBB62_06355 [Proteiniphilum sp.]|jgi:hypothetical protein|nr:hypothetical protein [Proteiniphilum sp.]
MNIQKNLFRKLLSCYISIILLFSCVPEKKTYYADIYDPISDVGQYKLPALNKTPKLCWDIVIDGNNPPLKDYLLAASITGLTSKAMLEGKTDVGVWITNPSDKILRTKKKGSHWKRGDAVFSAKLRR